MTFTPEQISSFQKTYKKAFNETLSDEAAVAMMDKLLYFYRKILTHARTAAADEATTKETSETVVVYAVRNQHMIVCQDLEVVAREPKLDVPAGAIRVGESPELAAHRIIEAETGRTGFVNMRLLGSDETDKGRRHFFQCDVRATLPYAGWRRFDSYGINSPNTVQCIWIPIRDAAHLRDNQGAFAHRIIQTAA